MADIVNNSLPKLPNIDYNFKGLGAKIKTDSYQVRSVGLAIALLPTRTIETTLTTVNMS